MKKHNNKFFIIIVPICIILILAMIFYDRYQTSQLAKKYNDTNNQTTQVSSNNDFISLVASCVCPTSEFGHHVHIFLPCFSAK